MEAEKVPFQRSMYFILEFRPQDSDLFGCSAHLTVKLNGQNGTGCFLKGVAFFALQESFIKIYQKMAQRSASTVTKSQYISRFPAGMLLTKLF